MMRCCSYQAASTQVPIVINLELARRSKRCPRLAGASSVAYPVWREEESKKPSSLRQAMPSNELRRLAGLKCRCELRALLASKGGAVAAAAALLALT